MRIADKDYSISFVRMIATVFIVTCHIMQYFNFVLAWWFNVGVQMFLFLSGYLYGKRQHVEAVPFYSRNYKKLLVDFYFYAVIVLVVNGVVGRLSIGRTELLNYLLLKSFPGGLNHFWFIPCILVCYGLTPVLIEVVNHADRQSDFQFAVYSAALLVVVDVVFSAILTSINSVWINCYVLGMLICRLEKRRGKCIYGIGLALLTLLMNGLQIYIDYFTDIGFGGIRQDIYLQWCSYAHVFLGISLVMVLRWFYVTFMSGMEWLKALLNWFDRYSYDIYITHHLFILGPYSLLSLPLGCALSVPLALVSTALSAVGLNALATLCRKKIRFLS